MHILMISDVFFPRINGVSTSIHSFRQHLAALGHRVTLLCPAYPADQPGDTSDSRDDRDILRIPSRRVPIDPEDRLMQWRPLRQAARDLPGEPIDLVHLHTPFVAHYAGRRIAREHEVPLLETYHTFFEEYVGRYVPLLPRPWLRKLAKDWSRRQCMAVDHLLVPSTAMRDILARYGVSTGMTILPTGIEPGEPASSADARAFRARHDIPPGAPLLLYVGRIAGEKNIDFLLDMLPSVLDRHPDAILAIAGEGPARAGLERRVAVEGRNTSVRFIGYMRRDGPLQAAYRAADLFVFASKSETQGLVLLEALAQGTPVVAIAAMGTRDVLAPDGGCRIAPDDPAAFAGEVIELLDRPDRRKAMADAARRYARTWSAGKMTQELVAVYADLVRNATPSG
jgi:hypothetical protein